MSNKHLTFSNHSKKRYTQRIDNKQTMPSTVKRALNNGLCQKDIPIGPKYNWIRKYISDHKIYYDGTIYVFNSHNYKRLVTCYKANPGIDEQFKKVIEYLESIKKPDEITFKKIKIDIFNLVILFKDTKVIKIFCNHNFDKSKYNLREAKFQEATNICNNIWLYIHGVNLSTKCPIEYYNISKNQIKIYEEIRKIAPGKTVSYSYIAKKTGFTPFYVSKMLNKCPLPIVIPTHRIIRTNGGIGKYSLDIKYKKRLLEIENPKIKIKK